MCADQLYKLNNTTDIIGLYTILTLGIDCKK